MKIILTEILAYFEFSFIDNPYSDSHNYLLRLKKAKLLVIKAKYAELIYDYEIIILAMSFHRSIIYNAMILSFINRNFQI